MGQQPDTPSPSKPRLVGLDMLRLLAVLLVLGRHMGSPPQSWPSGWRSMFLAWQRGGWVGVDLFFVLSGFLISGLLFTEYKSRGHLSIGRFYMRRGWKIYPPFFALLAATVIIKLLYEKTISRRPLASELVFLQSYVSGLWNHTWSLAVEEHFYLLLPLLLTLLLRWNRGSPSPFKPIPALAASIGVSVLLLRVLNWYFRSSYSHLTHLFATHLRFDSLFFGVAISYVYHFQASRFIGSLTPWRRWLVLGGVGLFIPAFVLPLETTPFIFTLGLTLFYFGSGMLMVGILLGNLPRGRPVVLAATLGAYSYSIYLWHMPVLEWGVPLVEQACDTSLGFGVRTVVYLIGSLIVGVIMAKIIEAPALRLRDRWFPSRGPRPIQDEPGHPPQAERRAG